MSEVLHSGSPWRHVEHIDMRTGPRGGNYYRLRLSCGHSVSRSIRPLSLVWLTGLIVNMERSDGRRPLRQPKRTAPARVKCIFCNDSET